VVVDDGSTDGTAQIVREYGRRPGVTAVCLGCNQGKGYAMAEGVVRAHEELLAFVDADLLNWSAEYLDTLIAPLQGGKADMAIGYPLRERDQWESMDPLGLLNWLSGERAVYRRDVLPLVARMRSSRFGVETLLNLHFRVQKKPVTCFPIRGLVHPVKLEKEGWRGALGSYMRELWEIVLAAAGYLPEMAPQGNWDSLSRRKKVWLQKQG
jgi:glycosyltransferase involved in cell wall biosynthesis